MNLLHDKYTIKNSFLTAYKNDNYTTFPVQKRTLPTLECFLSCSVRNVKHLTQKTLTKIIRAIDIPRVYSSNYRAVASQKLYGFNLDGVSGPSEKPLLIIGIDPGVSGALAVIKLHEKVTLQGVYDLPTYTLKVGQKNRKRLDLGKLALLIEAYSDAKFAIIEDVQSMSSDGHLGAFTFGFATGAVHGVLATLGIKIEKIKPQVWKSAMGLDSDKSKSIGLAIKLLPESKKFLTHKNDHGKAEAILLALFAYKHMRK